MILFILFKSILIHKMYLYIYFVESVLLKSLNKDHQLTIILSFFLKEPLTISQKKISKLNTSYLVKKKKEAFSYLHTFPVHILIQLYPSCSCSRLYSILEPGQLNAYFLYVLYTQLYPMKIQKT